LSPHVEHNAVCGGSSPHDFCPSCPLSFSPSSYKIRKREDENNNNTKKTQLQEGAVLLRWSCGRVAVLLRWF
jgi:hypothetical protein